MNTSALDTLNANCRLAHSKPNTASKRISIYRSTGRRTFFLFASTLTFLCTAFLAVSAEEQASTGLDLAQPGFLEHPIGHAGYLGFRSSVYLGEQGIWGALLLTTEQGEALKQAFAETWVRRNEDQSLDGETSKELERDFNRRRDEILTEQQRLVISDINRIYAELEVRQKAEGWKRIEAPLEAIKVILPPENYANLERTLGQKP